MAALVGGGIGLFVLGAIVGGLVVFFVAPLLFASSEHDSITFGEGGDREVFTIAVGQCANANVDGEGPLTPDHAVDCTRPHRLEVFHSGEMPPELASDRYDRHDLEYYADGVCFYAFEPYVGRDYDSSALDYRPVIPSASAWRGGERKFHCVLFHVDGERLSRSARDSGL